MVREDLVFAWGEFSGRIRFEGGEREVRQNIERADCGLRTVVLSLTNPAGPPAHKIYQHEL